ncbi:hypothetical protein PQU94_07975 [Asticcacaulis sp. DXS10W]|uniref:Uncharacterized protein n=1 Tax=Asticcacaulis currens TaxID=2984210 RepID=A0ABT5IDF4_9CAUL|nr:hypothetical protein [Asticcacaulis currens]MDC7694217.1 hypothetical protein [Asticcacaulis currens]
MKSHNRPDDVFMYLYRRIDGFTPNKTYKVAFSLRIATSAPPGCPGIGGAEGEAVLIKTGALAHVPGKVTKSNWARPDFDIGSQMDAGANSLVLGNIAKSIGTCGAAPVFEFKSLSSGTNTLPVTANAQGEIWLYAGTDSGYEGVTEVYFTDGSATFTAVP